MSVQLLTRHDRAMSTPYAFREADNWAGGFYELAIEVGPRNDARLQRVLTAVWSAADVQGALSERSGALDHAPGRTRGRHPACAAPTS